MSALIETADHGDIREIRLARAPVTRVATDAVGSPSGRPRNVVGSTGGTSTTRSSRSRKGPDRRCW